jgi:hypothetical protein
LFTPTLVVWSVSALKESSFFFLVAIAIAALQVAFHGLGTVRRPVVLAWLVRLAAVIVAYEAMRGVQEIRPVGWAVCVAGFGLGAAAWFATRRAWLCVASIAIGAVLAVQLLQRPDVQARLLEQFRITAITHLGNVKTVGYAYKLLDAHYYTRWATENSLAFMTFDDAMRYAIRAAVSFVTVPTPWQVTSRFAIAYLPEQILWYVALVLAIFGIASGVRRDSWLTCLLVGYAVVGAGIISLPSGNIGTFIRMRGMIVPYVLCLSALGGCVVLDGARRWFQSQAARVTDIRSEESHALAR